MTSHRILWIGCSFGGLASIKKFVELFSQIKPVPAKQFDLYIIDPRAGFLNILGIPRAILDVDFARFSYINVENFNLNFDTVESNDEGFRSRVLNAERNQSIPSNLRFHFIHGKCVRFIDHHNIKYKLNGEDSAEETLGFDYAIFSTGRKRNWPYDPVARTEDELAKEVESFKPAVEAAKTISIVGAGALGIELAGEIIEYYKGAKKVILIHPHPTLPPETFATLKFKNQLESMIREAGVEIQLNTRVERELDNGELLTTDGRIIKSDLVLWSNSHSNNIEPLLPVFAKNIEPVKNEVIVDLKQLVEGCDNVFVIGDVIKRDIIKTAGAAWHQGQRVSQTLINFLVLDKEEYEEADPNPPKGMTIVVGTDHCISQWDDIGEGKIILNDEIFLNLYEDYCTTNTKKLLELK